MSITVVIPSRNEASNVARVVQMITSQTRQPTEVVVADGMSTDGSRELWQAAKIPGVPLKLLDNRRKSVPAGLNLALSAASGELVARMDTHAHYAPNYLEKVATLLETRADVQAVGGAMATAGRGPWGLAIAAVLRRPFGLGGARHRVNGTEGPIQHVFSGCYRRTALAEAGGWDERLLANEDFEADLRVAQSGGTIWLNPEAKSTWYVRESPRALAKQMWRYGYYKALTLLMHPRSLRSRQLAPPALVLGMCAAGAAGRRPLLAVGGVYLSFAMLSGAAAARTDGASPSRGALVTPIVHLSWGAGLLAGLVRFGGSAAIGRR
ncbi:glycosyltransferase family 2 protein [Blastococcus montanus]|uniref:glycosyltransferase family 2 protein n=1 Tax=Blastococcus montanus TaxID=3144973 RepID=UPI00320920E6